VACRLLAAALWALAVLVLLALRRDDIDDRRGAWAHERAPAPGAPARAARAEHPMAFMRLPSVWLCFSFFFWTSASLVAIQSFAAPALVRLYGLPLAGTAFVVTGFMLCGAAGMVVGGFVVGRVQRLERTIAVSMAGAAGLLLLVASGLLPVQPGQLRWAPAPSTGRDIPLLTIGRDPDRLRPGGLGRRQHARQRGLRLQRGAGHRRRPDRHHQGADGPAASRCRAHGRRRCARRCSTSCRASRPTAPRRCCKRGRYVRSSPVDDRVRRPRALAGEADVDGDGRAGYHAPADPDGELVELRGDDGQPLDPPVMVARQPEDEARSTPLPRRPHRQLRRPHASPTPYFLSDNAYDFNRNFPYHWAPEPQQAGAGHYPGSAPETRAVIDFATRHPNIMVWLNLHTFGGVLIRPLGDKPDSKMDPGDLAIFEQVEAWMTEHTGYATVSGFHEFLYEPDKPLHGDLSDYAYHQRGALAYVVELWDLFQQLGIERKKPFVDHYSKFTRKPTCASWPSSTAAQRRPHLRPWRKVQHPQLGEVEWAASTRAWASGTRPTSAWTRPAPARARPSCAWPRCCRASA
jgi:hypothetical protein